MTCMEAEKMVIPYINDQLSVTELEDFIEHIKTCENCREELEIHYMVDVGLKKLDEADGTYDIGDDVENAGTAKLLKNGTVDSSLKGYIALSGKANV